MLPPRSRPRTSSPIRARRRPAILSTFALGILLVAGNAGGAPLDVAGSWTGTFARTKPRATAAVTATLAQRDAQLTGWIGLALTSGAIDVPVVGKAKRRGLVLKGAVDGTDVRWTARRRGAELRGKLRVRGPAGTQKGILVVEPEADGGPRCGTDYFRDTVMPEVLVPVCGQCHVPGGLAELTTLRVTPGDPTATAASAAAHVDGAAPPASRLLRKPRAELPHEGGVQLTAGSPRDDVLRRWIELVADCIGGGEQSGASLYADYCAGCHAADAGGMAGGPGERTRPNIRCATRVADAVTSGRGDAMPPVAELGEVEIGKIAEHLDGLCREHGRTGAALFAGNCVSCHGADARGTTSALGVAGRHVRCHRGIADAVATGRTSASGDMPAFPGLAAADVAAIGDYLRDLCPPGGAGGDELFASNCARCHGDDAGGLPPPPGERRRPAVRCASPSWIADALATGRAAAMPSFPGVVASDVAALVSFLDATCTQNGRSGFDLYDGNCATCHGADAGGGRNALGVIGPDVRCSVESEFLDRISDGEGDMPAFPELVPDAPAIAAFVAGGFCDED